MHRHIWKTPNAAYQHKLLIPTAEHGDGGVMIWEKRKLPRFSNSPVEVQPSNRFNLKKAAHKQMPGNLDGLKQLYKVGQNSSRVM